MPVWSDFDEPVRLVHPVLIWHEVVCGTEVVTAHEETETAYNKQRGDVGDARIQHLRGLRTIGDETGIFGSVSVRLKVVTTKTCPFPPIQMDKMRQELENERLEYEGTEVLRRGSTYLTRAPLYRLSAARI
jgi:hypothetical protein